MHRWFPILYGDEEESISYKDLMMIEHIEKEHLPLVHKLPLTETLIIWADK